MTDPAVMSATEAGAQQAATVVHQWTDAQLANLIKALTPAPSMAATAVSDVDAFIAKVKGEVGSASRTVKAFPWGHVVTYIMSVATPIAIHFLGLFGL